MKRFAFVAVTLVLCIGCRAPVPDWDMFRPYGATRVPAPPTGGYGASQPYYSPGSPNVAPTSTPVGTGFRTTPANRWSNANNPDVGSVAAGDASVPAQSATSNTQDADLQDVDVALASHESAARIVPSTVVVQHDGPIRIAPSSPRDTGTPQLRGMVVHDMTQVTEPQPFVPSGKVVDISQLPDAPVATRPTSTGRTTSSTNTAPASEATVSDGGWKSRTTTLRVAGT